MLKKTITFKDLDDNDVTEDFYFNLSKAEIAEMELSHPGGLGAHLRTVIASENGELIITTFKEIITKSVGKRSEDGRRFIKNQDVADEFLQSDAYSVMFMELLTDAGKGAEFIRGIVPADISAEMPKELENVPLPQAQQSDEVPAWIREDREPTQKELQSMTPDQLREAFARKANKSA